MLLPYQPPCTSPPCRRGLYRQHIGHQKSRQAGVHHLNCTWMEWSPCRHTRPAALGKREAKRMERRREGRREGVSHEPTKCLGSPDPRSEARP